MMVVHCHYYEAISCRLLQQLISSLADNETRRRGQRMTRARSLPEATHDRQSRDHNRSVTGDRQIISFSTGGLAK
jgi:hypothetical protein